MFKKSVIFFLLIIFFKINFSFSQDANERIIKGVVTSASDKSILPSATIKIKGTTKGTLADFDGNYMIKVPSQGKVILEFSYTSMQIEERLVGKSDVINVELFDDKKTTELSEIQVVGYGTQEKADVTGTISSVTEKQIKELPLTSIDQAMQGRAAGVQITQNSAAPGGAVSVRVRGPGSFNSSDPLYVIDGIPVFNDNNASSIILPGGNANPNNNVLASLNPNDIERIDVLKDASATAIYGSRGANGVVMITTKRGKDGAPKISYDAYFGMQEVWKKIPMLNTRQFTELNIYANYIDQSPWYSGFNPYVSALTASSPQVRADSMASYNRKFPNSTDWQSEIFRTAPISSHQFNVSGGTPIVKYNVSAGYFDQKGVVVGSGFNRYSFRVNLDIDATKRLKFATSLSLNRTEQTIVPTDGWGSVITGALTFLPFIRPLNDQGLYNVFTPSAFPQNTNPLLKVRENKNENTTYRFLGNTSAEYKITDYLSFKVAAGIDFFTDKFKSYSPFYLGNGISQPGFASGIYGMANELIWLNENTLNFNKSFGKKNGDKSVKIHSVNAVLGFTMQAAHRENLSVSKLGYVTDELNTLGAGGLKQTSANGFIQEWSLMSFIARVNYSLYGKYLLTATVRRDGSSRFGADNSFGNFPSVSAGWRISEERFMKTQKTISELKLRASIGVTGNQEIGNYRSQQYMQSPALYQYVFGKPQTAVFGNSPNGDYGGGQTVSLANSAITWEETMQTDIGVEIGFFKNRIQATADYWIKNTSRLLIEVPIPDISGYFTSLRNLGKLENRGLDITLTTRNLEGNFKWTTDLNWSTYTNRIIERADITSEFGLVQSARGAGAVGQTLLQIGQPIGSFYGAEAIGVFKNYQEIYAYKNKNGNVMMPNAKPGDIIYKDSNGDGVVDPSGKDRTVLGSALPIFFGGLTNKFSYQNFDLTIFLQGQFGNKVFNYTRAFLEDMTGNQNNSTAVLNRYIDSTNVGDGITPRASAGASSAMNGLLYSSRWIEDGSFLRIRNLTLGYTIPESVLQNSKISNVRIYLGIQNAFTFTSYKGFDPEMNSNGSQLMFPGYDLGTFPQSRTYLAGLNVSF